MSKIEWTEETWNLVTGCTKISEGCQNCYAEKMHKRLKAMGQHKYQHDFEDIFIHSSELNRNFGNKPKMIFVNSMSDIFHKDVPREFIYKIFAKMSLQPQHTFQILTKRPPTMCEFSTLLCFHNVWLGTTVESAKYKHRIDILRDFKAKTKFLSCEPLLGDLGELDLTGINWVIVGGESGPSARPMHPDWVRNIQRQCQEQHVPFFFKQWGEWAPIGSVIPRWDYDKYKKHIFKDGCSMYKVGKKKAGCLLDRKEYKEYPACN